MKSVNKIIHVSSVCYIVFTTSSLRVLTCFLKGGTFRRGLREDLNRIFISFMLTHPNEVHSPGSCPPWVWWVQMALIGFVTYTKEGEV